MEKRITINYINNTYEPQMTSKNNPVITLYQLNTTKHQTSDNYN